MADLVKDESALRGEITANLGGKERKLRLTIGQLENLEIELGRGVIELMQRFADRTYTMGELRTVLAEGMKKGPEHPRPKPDEVREMIWQDNRTESGGCFLHHVIAGRLLQAAIGFDVSEKGKEDENPPSGESE